jgi:hypothetical protein
LAELLLGRWMPRQPSFEKKSAVRQHPVEQRFEALRVVFAEAAQKLRLHPVLGGDELRKQRLAGNGELEIHRAPVVGMRDPAHEALLLQPIDHPRHRAGIVRDRLAQAGRRIGFAIGDGRQHEELRRRDIEWRELAVQCVDELDPYAIDQAQDSVPRLRVGQLIEGDGCGA